MALTLVAEAGILQRLYHSAHHRVTRHWHRQRRRYASRSASLPVRAGSSGRSLDAVAADTEDEDVRAERELIQSGGELRYHHERTTPCRSVHEALSLQIQHVVLMMRQLTARACKFLPGCVRALLWGIISTTTQSKC